MKRRGIISNIAILASGRLTTMAISAVSLIIVTRYLGPGRVGQLALAGAIVGLLGQVNAMGVETFLIRAVAREPERTGKLVSAALMLRVVLAIPVPFVLLAYVHFAHLDRETSAAAFIFGLGMIMWSFCAVPLWALQGLELMSFVAINDIVLNVVLLATDLLVIVLHGGVIAFAARIPFIQVGMLLFTFRWARPHMRFTRRVSWADMLELIRGSLAFWAKDITMTLYTFIDSVILGSLAGVRAVGFYSPPTQIFSVALFVPNVVGNATLPLLSRLGIDVAEDFARVGRKTVALLILVGVPLVVGLATFAGPVITLLFGPAFQPAVPVLQVLSLALLPMFLNSQFAQILTANDRQWSWTGIMMACVGVNVGINFVLIPFAVHYWHNGALGAAAALVCTEVIMTVYGMILLRDVVMERALGRTAVGALLAGAAQWSVVWLMGSQWLLLVVGEALGVGIYVALVSRSPESSAT